MYQCKHKQSGLHIQHSTILYTTNYTHYKQEVPKWSHSMFLTARHISLTCMRCVNFYDNYINHSVTVTAIPSDNITVDSVSYSSSNITVNLTLSAEGIGPGILFNVSTVPPIGTPTVYNSSEVIQLTLLYNIVYNLSIESVTDPYCGHQAGASTRIQLKYSKFCTTLFP